MEKQITLNGTTINYDLQRKKMKTLRVRIDPYKGVIVSASKKFTLSDIEEFLRKNADFIIKNTLKYQETAKKIKKPLKYVDGETFFFLGTEKIITVAQASTDYISTDGNRLHIFVSDPNNFKLKEKTIDNWLKQETERLVTKYAEQIYPYFEQRGFKKPTMDYKKWKSLWGCCKYNKAQLSFNIHLAQVPEKCVEMIVAHEFSHFIHHNHSKDFYSLLAELIPDWKERNKTLKAIASNVIIKETKW